MRRILLVALPALAACFSDAGPIAAVTTATTSTSNADTSSTGPDEPTLATTGMGTTAAVTTAEASTTDITTNDIATSSDITTSDITSTTAPNPPVCGDALCDASESCLLCAADCGACPLPYPPGGRLDPVCSGDDGDNGFRCNNISGAFTSAAVNVGYYPFRIKPGVNTELYTCDDRAIQGLAPGQGFAAQSTRNPNCSDNPPLRDARAGYVFGYARGSGVSGWVPAEALEFVGYDGGACADGQANSDWQVANNPYDGCKPMPCDGVNTCAAANPIDPNDPDNSDTECGGFPISLVRTIAAPYVPMYAAPGSTPVQYVHAGDEVKVNYFTKFGWYFVELKSSTCPSLSPVGLRGWLENKAENFEP
jgi:hypothetical protein